MKIGLYKIPSRVYDEIVNTNKNFTIVGISLNKAYFKKYRGDHTLEYNQDIKNRLKRIEGQIRGVLRMIEEEKDCKEVITQLTASRSAMDRTIGLIVGTNLENCLREQFEKGDTSNEDLIKEAVQLLVKSR